MAKRVSFLLAAWACTGCATSPGEPSRPSPASEAELARAEKLYRGDDPAFAEVRDDLARDPRNAYWLTCLFVYDLVSAQRRRAADDETFLATVRGDESPVESRALAGLRALGPAALPAVERELLRSRHTDLRMLGAHVITEIGPAVVDHLEPLLADDDWRLRRAVVAAVAAMEPTPATGRVLLDATGDEEFAVRGAAFEGLAHHGTEHVALLRRAATTDPDPYVRRVAAEALGAFPDRETAETLVEVYADGVARGDRRTVQVADRALRRIAGRERPGDLTFWRAWLSTWQGGEGI